jgi:DNA-binding winged helix-turn-helix (wHTH) protein
MGLRIRADLKVTRPTLLCIGEWLVKPNENSLSNATSQQNLEPKLMNLLLWLAQHANEVQSNEVLLQQIWGGTFYSDNPLHRSIAVLRRALGDSAVKPRFIRTVRKRGYQLIASVSLPDSAPVPLDTQTRFQGCGAFPSLDSFVAADAPGYFGRVNALAALASALQQLLEHLCKFQIDGRPVFPASELHPAFAFGASEITSLSHLLKRGLAQAGAGALARHDRAESTQTQSDLRSMLVFAIDQIEVLTQRTH